MKSFNVDNKLKDPEIIRQAIIKTCKSKKKKRKGQNRKYKQAQYILKNLDRYTKKTLEIIIAFEEVQQSKERGGKIDIEVFRKAYKPKKCDPCGKQYIEKVINHHTKYDKSAIKYTAQLDIAKCYQSISHKELKRQLKRKFRGKLFLWLTFAVIDSYHDKIVDGEPTGLPIGYSTSHWFCNFMLTPLDYFIKQELKVNHYIRYMDDMVLFGRNKRKLHKVVRSIMMYLNKIGLKIKHTWQVFRFDYIDRHGKRRGRDIDFLGYRFFRDKIILRKRNALKLRRQVMRIHRMKEITAHVAQSLMSRLGWLRHCNSFNFWHKYVKPYINIKKIKEVIRNESRKYHQACTVQH